MPARALSRRFSAACASAGSGAPVGAVGCWVAAGAPSDFPRNAGPHRKYLDPAVPRPTGTTARSRWASGTREQARHSRWPVSRATADPPDGWIVRRPEGEPTGLLKESAASLVRGWCRRHDRRNRPAAARRTRYCGVVRPDLAAGPAGRSPHAKRDAAVLRAAEMGMIRSPSRAVADQVGVRAGPQASTCAARIDTRRAALVWLRKEHTGWHGGREDGRDARAICRRREWAPTLTEGVRTTRWPRTTTQACRSRSTRSATARSAWPSMRMNTRRG